MDLKIFSGRSNEPLARKVAGYIGDKLSQKAPVDFTLGSSIIKDHADGEVHVHFGESLRGDDVFLVQSTNQPERNFAELKQMVLAAKQSQARSVTVVIPYFGYARQDRRDRPRAAVEAVGRAKDLVGRGASRFLLLDPHSNAIEAGLAWEPIPVDRLWAKGVLAPFLKCNISLFPFDPDNLVVASP
ncbi:MAG: ribose-phosphate pyrophosphokinase-like domain-containing protein, partial [Candidatus Spechtbacterales bacterium]